MTKDEFKDLKEGDVVLNKMDRGHGYIVHANYGGRVTAVRTADLTNHEEWEITHKCIHSVVED